MKKILLGILLSVASVVSLNAKGLSEDELANLRGSCTELQDKRACQKLIKNGLTSVEKCNKIECSDAGDIYYGAGNFSQALRYYNKACDLGHSWSCFFAAEYFYKQGLGTKKDDAMAKKYYIKACDLGNYDACNKKDSTNNTSLKSSDDELIGLIGRCTEMADESVCEKLFKKGLPSVEKCSKESCRHIGLFYASFQHSYKNEQQAIKYFQKACDLGDENGCKEQEKLNSQGVK